MSVESGFEDLDREELRKSLERNLQRLERASDGVLKECGGVDRPWYDGRGKLVARSAIRMAVNVKQGVVRLMAELRRRASERA